MVFSRGVPAPPKGGVVRAGSGAASCAEHKFCRKKDCFFPDRTPERRATISGGGLLPSIFKKVFSGKYKTVLHL